jgi:hypothetical protein
LQNKNDPIQARAANRFLACAQIRKISTVLSDGGWLTVSGVTPLGQRFSLWSESAGLLAGTTTEKLENHRRLWSIQCRTQTKDECFPNQCFTFLNRCSGDPV